MKPKFPKPCGDCGALSANNYCDTHQAIRNEQVAIRRSAVKQATKQYSGPYKRLAKQIREATIICAICGDGARWNDPWQADHIIPATEVQTIADLQGVHASCNRTKSNNPQKIPPGGSFSE